MKNTVIKSLQWRYATKSFDSNKTLPEAKIKVLKEGFNLTATSYGLQPVKMVLLKNKALQQKLVAYSYHQKQIAEASHVIVLCVEREITSQYIETYFNSVKALRGTPDEVLNPFKEFLISDFAKKTSDEILTWATKQAYIALGNLLTICALEQIDSCPMEGFEPHAYDEILGLKDKGLQSVLVLPIGYRADSDMFASLVKVRKDITDSVIEM